MCAIIQHDKYELNQIIIIIIFLSSSFVFAPLPLFISLSSEWTEPAIISLWHILYFEFHLQNQQLNVYVVVYWKLYLHMRLYVFSLYRVWYCISSTSVNFTGLGPYLSDRVRWAVPPGSVLRWLVSAGAAGGSRAEAKHLRNVKGHILDSRSCK